MAIKYKVEQAKVGFGKDKSEAYVGRIQLGDTVSTEKLEEQGCFLGEKGVYISRNDEYQLFIS